MIKDLTFLHFLTASVIIELFMMILFRFTKSPFTGISINRWYDNLGWTAVILDILSILIGFYIAKFIYEYLVKENEGHGFRNEENRFEFYEAMMKFLKTHIGEKTETPS